MPGDVTVEIMKSELNELITLRNTSVSVKSKGNAFVVSFFSSLGNQLQAHVHTLHIIIFITEIIKQFIILYKRLQAYIKLVVCL